ncbi:IS5 family transposase [Acidovorax sp. GBBC 1281]|uniref:IS5 family transposase n=1 Tax=Acidovorax sp. GBBC 1281 TaxID=2940492 RepID=UPI00234AB792|nr:IS5 family transposase [Acidovorax sp. GBBC 1281]WCM95548.1 IS5 family transposase [Acidovorax sp. GBBC 1281]WCM95550.1 IS5 family transposase [Acidovorax sp. GBBC 1281]WCM96644.1 IS5 family transposase [Acidovorax sp. GBBC 1281]WCM98179.1 IS5 family transposase [Acidovorax sp. GBBC 1281]WCN00121.1 IS5 family transposase [Acidovorax sp. GBBC 1281]
MSEGKKMRTRYRTTNWAQYNAALKARGSLTMWLDRGMQWLAEPKGKRGRNQTFSDAAIQFCLSIKCLFGQPLRQALGMVQSLLKLAGVNWPVPDFSTVCRRQKDLQVQLNYQPRSSPLHLLVDSTGIKFLGEGECKRKRHGAEYRREWRKVHLGIDAQTLEIRAIEVTSNAIGDAPMLPQLLAQMTKMHCFKRLGERVMARTFERQVVELHVRVALLNRFSQLGRPETVAVAAVA